MGSLKQFSRRIWLPDQISENVLQNKPCVVCQRGGNKKQQSIFWNDKQHWTFTLPQKKKKKNLFSSPEPKDLTVLSILILPFNFWIPICIGTISLISPFSVFNQTAFSLYEPPQQISFKQGDFKIGGKYLK